jgi:NitT/TauT family transport system substrate-binding protein
MVEEKMLTKRFTLLVLVILIISLLLPACSSSPQGEVPDLGTIQVGYLPATGFFGFYVAKEKGYFEEQGLDVELTSFKSGAEMIAPLSTGQLDAGAGEPGTALFNAASQDLDMKVVCGFSSQAAGHGGVPILVRKDLADSGEVTGPGDLKGRKIGINVPRGMAEYSVAKYLAKDGLTIDDVELVPIAFSEMPAAFANKAIDAGMMTYPSAGKAIKDGSAVILVKGDEIAGEIQNGVMYFGKRLLDPANEEVAVRFLTAYLKAIRELQGDDWKKDEVLQIVNKYTNQPPEVIASAVQSFNNPNCGLVYDSLEDVQNYYLARGYTDYTEALPSSDFILEDFAKEVIAQLGEYKE